MPVTASELSRLSELIDSIYQGATDPSHWNSSLPAIANWLGAPRGLLFTPRTIPDQGGFYFNHGIPEMMMQLWATKYVAKDLWAIRGVELGLDLEGNVALGEEIVPFDEFRQSEVYQELLSRFDIAHVLTSCVFGRNSPNDHPLTVCALYRSLEDGRFDSEERGRLAMLLPHISRSLGVMMRLRNAEMKIASTLSALDRLGTGVLLFGPGGQVTFANRAALRVMEAEDGLRLRHLTGATSFGEVVAEDSMAHAALTAAIRNAVSPDILHMEHFSRAVSIPRPSGRLAYTLSFSSLAVHNEFGHGTGTPSAIAFIADSAEPIRLNGDLLKKVYGLTPAEIRLAEIITECLTAKEAAERMSLSEATVKKQLQSIYDKTQTNNRARLMRLIVSLAEVAG